MSDPDITPTESVLSQILTQLNSISKSVISIEQHLDEQDLKIDGVRGQTNLAGNIASEAMNLAKETRDIVFRIDQSLTGIYELAKSGFDIATAIKSVQNTEPTPDDDDPIVEIDNGIYRKFSIVGTGN